MRKAFAILLAFCILAATIGAASAWTWSGSNNKEITSNQWQRLSTTQTTTSTINANTVSGPVAGSGLSAAGGSAVFSAVTPTATTIGVQTRTGGIWQS